MSWRDILGVAPPGNPPTQYSHNTQKPSADPPNPPRVGNIADIANSALKGLPAENGYNDALLIFEARACGAVLTTDSGRLEIEDSARLPPDLREQLRQRAREVFRLLAGTSPAAEVVSLVRCGDCRHFQPDVIWPPGGLGKCTIKADGNPRYPGYRPTYPFALRQCSKHLAATPPSAESAHYAKPPGDFERPPS